MLNLKPQLKSGKGTGILHEISKYQQGHAMKNKLRLALIAGGKSGEREVSLKGAEGVAAALDPEIFSHGNLETLNCIAIPKRFQQGIHEAEKEHVVHLPFPEIMIDAENRLFV